MNPTRTPSPLPRALVAGVFLLFLVAPGGLSAAEPPSKAKPKAVPADGATAKVEAGFVPLFDGVSFAGWEGDTDKTFRIEGGAIVGGSLKARVPHNFFLATEKPYRDFVLRLKFKLIGKGANAGVQIRSRRIPNHHEMIGYQADMGDPRWWGCLYDESRRNRVLAASDMAKLNPVLKREDWNDYEIRCEGKRVVLKMNGLVTVDYTEPDDKIVQEGLIALQIHGGPPSEAWYKDIRIKEL